MLSEVLGLITEAIRHNQVILQDSTNFSRLLNPRYVKLEYLKQELCTW